VSTHRSRRHLVLIGLPGVGKTSIGRHLSRLIGRPFADADEQLELVAGRTIPWLVRERGQEELSRREDETLADLLDRDAGLVISAPGAVILGRANRARLAESSVVVWIHAPVDFVAGLGDPTHRPRLADGQEAALLRLERELAPTYARVASHIVDVERFHATNGGDQPRHAIARHIVALLGLGPVADIPPADPTGLVERAGELDALCAGVADHTVDVEPFHAAPDLTEHPKRAIARHIAELLAE
jgi:shikimate kinase